MIELNGLGLRVPSGAVIGVLTDDTRIIQADALRIGPGEPIPSDARQLILDHTFSRMSLFEKTRAVSKLLQMSKSGASVMLISHEETLLERSADEIWVIRNGELVDRGDPGEVLARYRLEVARDLRESGEGGELPLSPTMRKGDGRARIASISLPSTVVNSGEETSIRVTVDYASEVEDPVVGIMIRTRIGLNVYGTNTELEGLRFGPVGAGDGRTVSFRFRCDLCPGDYTITAASHDPNGIWHEWLEDAVSFAVTDSRYTAGVANLRAHVSVD